MKKLFLIPARGGSKGLPRKNILPLAGRPMIQYTLDAATASMEEGDELCVSTDDEEIIRVVQEYGVKVPFVRPAEIATDESSSQDVIEHAIKWYESNGIFFELVVLLQPTSPLRNAEHVLNALTFWSDEIDMLVSVNETDSNPYYTLFEEDAEGFLYKSKEGLFRRRQDCPKVFEYNGAIYLIGVSALQSKGFQNLHKKKYLMPKSDSIDIDDRIDFKVADILLRERKRNQS